MVILPIFIVIAMSVCWHSTDVPCPDKVIVENLDAALRTMDPVLKFRPVTGEKCIVNCPLRKPNRNIALPPSANCGGGVGGQGG